MDKIIITPDIKLNINKYDFMAPLIAASLTNALYSALSVKKADETNEEIFSRVLDLWSALTDRIEEAAATKDVQNKEEKQS